MSYYYPFGASPTKQNIDYARTAVSASSPDATAVTTLMPSALFASSVLTAPSAGTSGTSKISTECSTLTGAQGAQGAVGPAGNPGTDMLSGMCPPGTKECTALNASLTALNATQGPNDQFGVVCLNLDGRTATSLDCPASLPTGVPTLPTYT